MNRATRILSGLAIIASVLSVLLAFYGLRASAARFGVNWGLGFYVITPLPYGIAACLALKFRSNLVEAVISLGGALAVGPLAVFVMLTAEDALTVQFLWFLSLLGCAFIWLTHLFHRGIRRSK